jgi:hypothetical protein
MMRLRKIWLLPLLVSSSFALAQETNWSGSWELDLERSDPLVQQGPPLPATEMTVTREGERLVLSRRFEFQGAPREFAFAYVGDGEPHEVPGLLGPRTTRARWKKDKLVVSYTVTRNTPAGTIDLDTIETWSLSRDGKELTIDYSSRMGDRPVTRREVFVRR